MAPFRVMKMADAASPPTEDRLQRNVPEWDAAAGVWKPAARMNWQATWQAGTYYRGDVVFTTFGVAVCAADSTTTDPTQPGSDWEFLTFYGVGAMEISTPTAGDDLGLGWNAIDEFDTIVIDGPGISFETTDGTFKFDLAGIWDLRVSIFFSHNSSNQGRTTFARLFNVTSGTPGNDVPIGIGRNVEDTSLIATLLAPISPADVGDTYRLELGGGSSVTSVTYENGGIEGLWAAPYFT